MVANSSQAVIGDVGRAELLRALGAVILTPPPSSDRVWEGLNLPCVSGAEHTEAFVLLAPPHAAIHLGAEGKLGGDALDRVEGFWRALGATVPPDADHLGVLLMAYAELADSATTSPVVERAATTLFHEHLWSFAPGYLAALRTAGAHGVQEWCDLALQVLRAECDAIPAPVDLPLALRAAPAPIAVDIDIDDLLDAIVAPVRIGMVLTQYDVATGARELGVGYRRGERRFALTAMMQQDKVATLSWLAGLANEWADRHALNDPQGCTGRWWASRATTSARVLDTLMREAS